MRNVRSCKYSRPWSQNDFIIESENDLNYLPQNYEIDSIASVRNNQALSINDYGQQLLDLCVAAKLRISMVGLGEISKDI